MAFNDQSVNVFIMCIDIYCLMTSLDLVNATVCKSEMAYKGYYLSVMRVDGWADGLILTYLI